MPWWGWIVLGFFLLVTELMTPGGFYLFFFGIGALVVGAISGLGWIEADWIECLLFSVLSISALFFFRRRILNFLASDHPKEVDTLIGETATALSDMVPGEVCKVEFRGTSWNARNIEETLIHKGQRCKVEKREELVLFVRKE
ncbi:MAG: NfeD family protein [Nitrospirota bacterium]